MDYRRFEWLVIGVTAVIVAATAAMSIPTGGATPIEVGAQLAIVAVVAIGAHWGRKAGTLAGLGASVAYLALRLPLIATNTSGPAVLLVVSRVSCYLLLGIVGGEIFGRIKYVFTGSKDADTIDQFSRVFNEKFAAQTIRRALSRLDRYDEPFSLALVDFAALLSSTRSDRRQSLVRSVANVIRDDVRIVDDVAHLSDGRFVVILPHTHGAGARVVASRLAAEIAAAHNVSNDSIATECLSAADDRAAIHALCDQIDCNDGEVGQPASGE